MTRDPSGYAGGLNLYSYCGGNPVMLADPSGLDALYGGTGPAWSRFVDDHVFGGTFGRYGAYRASGWELVGAVGETGLNAATIVETGGALAALRGATAGAAAKGATGAFLPGARGGQGPGLLRNRSIRVSERGLSIVERNLEQFGDWCQRPLRSGSSSLPVEVISTERARLAGSPELGRRFAPSGGPNLEICSTVRSLRLPYRAGDSWGTQYHCPSSDPAPNCTVS